MRMIYVNPDGSFGLHELSDAPAAEGTPVAVVRGDSVQPLVPEESLDLFKLRILAKAAGLTLPESYQVPEPPKTIPEEIAEEGARKEKMRDAPEALSFASLKTSWKNTVSDTVKLVRSELQENASPKSREVVTKLGESVKSGSEKVGALSDNGIKPTFVLTSNKAILAAIGRMQRNLLSVSARLVEEALTTRLDSMTKDEKADFYSLYLEKLNNAENPTQASRLTSWHKVIRRSVR